MAMALTRFWTTADVRELTREERPWPRYELIDHELLVTPAPRGPHQVAVTAIWRLLDDFSLSQGIGVAMISPADLELQPGTITQPDVFVVPRGISQATGRAEWSEITALLLAVEVLSESTVRTDRVMKRDFYLANRVEEYWVVDTDARVIERWRPAQVTPELVRDSFAWQPRDGEPLVIEVASLFDRIEAKWAAVRAHDRGRGAAM